MEHETHSKTHEKTHETPALKTPETHALKMDNTTYNEIKFFTATLSRRRIELDDRALLDTCDQYLNLLLNELTPPPPTEAPTNIQVPYVGGSAVVGGALNCTMGTWSGEPTAYAYQWQRDGSDNGAPAGPDYAVTADDAGHVITCVVTATNSFGSTAAPPSNQVSIPAV